MNFERHFPFLFLQIRLLNSITYHGDEIQLISGHGNCTYNFVRDKANKQQLKQRRAQRICMVSDKYSVIGSLHACRLQ